MTVVINGTTGITSVNGSAAAPSVTGTDTDTGIVYGTNTITLATNGTAGLIQDASQNIGIGNTTPSAWNSSNKAIEFPGGALNTFSTIALNLTQNSYYDSSPAFKYKNTGPATLAQQYNGSHILYSADSGTAGTTATFTAVFTVAKDASIALQTRTPVPGIGISFPTTQAPSTDPNTLDDYEEGTYTVGMGSGAGSITSYTATGRYTKIGNVVSVWVNYTITNNGTGGSYGTVSLPFTTAYGTTGVTRIGGTTGNVASVSITNAQYIATLWTYSNSYPWATNANGDIFIQYIV